MSLPVYLAESLARVGPGSAVEVTGDEARHAVVVRRTRVGERVALTDGAGTSVTGEVTSTSKSGLSMLVATVESSEPEPASVTVVQAIPKGARGELAVEMLTEVGVDTLVPWAAERCVAVWRGERADKGRAKWADAAREAAKQSRRAWFPEVASLASTDEVLGLLRDCDLAVVLHEEASAPVAQLDVPATGRIVVVVGPEGGISDSEIDAFAAAGVTPVRLGETVLRTSTAGLAAVSALLSRTTRWA